MSATEPLATPPRLSLPALFLKFLRFGCLAFGGPVAQIAMVRQALVDEEKWIESPRFNRLLAVMQVLPGPEAHELCVHMGMMARGRIGGLLAGLGFMLPGFLLMLACGWAYAEFDRRAARARRRAARRAGGGAGGDRALGPADRPAHPDRPRARRHRAARRCRHSGRRAVLGAAGRGRVRLRRAPANPYAAVALAAVIVLGGWLLLPHGDAAPLAGTLVHPARAVAVLALFVAGLKGGLLTFGGAYTAIPYVRADTVGRGWLGDGQFLDGIALGNLLPAPLVIFATFAGYVAGGFPGALAITAGMFLPAFAFSMIFFERLEAVVEHSRLHRTLDGVAAAAVGVIAATLVQLALAAGERLDNPWLALPIFALAALAAWRLRGAWVTPLIVGAGAAAGWLVLELGEAFLRHLADGPPMALTSTAFGVRTDDRMRTQG